MKNCVIALASLACLILLASPLAAQVDRVILLEEFSADHCPKCPKVAEAIKEVSAERGVASLVIIRYGAWNDDKYNVANPEENNDRKRYYDIPPVPVQIVDGLSLHNGNESTVQLNKLVTENLIDTRRSEAPQSPFRITVDGTTGDPSFSVLVEAVGALPAGVLKLRAVLVEIRKEYSVAPGTNGQKTFEYSMLDMVPDADGVDLSVAAGGTETFSLTYDSARNFNDTDVAIVAFIQSEDTKEVYQTVYADFVNSTNSESANADLAFGLRQNYPNPFQASTSVSFSVPRGSIAESVRLDVFSMLGQKVATLAEGLLPPGRHTRVWQPLGVNGEELPAGIYHYRLQVGDQSLVRTMTLVR